MDFQIFLSYAKEDSLYADKLHDYLTNKQYPIWMDKHKIRVGEKWQNIISQAILKSSAVLVLLSKNSVTKIGYFQKEVRQIINRSEFFPNSKIFILPILLDDIEIPSEMKEIQYIDCSINFEIGLKKLFSNLEDVFNSEIWAIRRLYNLQKQEMLITQILNSNDLLDTLKNFDYWFSDPNTERKFNDKLDFFYKNKLVKRDGESRWQQGSEYYSEYCFFVTLTEEGKIIRDYILGKLQK